jgi:asparagine N-glycosylation enzyme membrane subunit Stt3
MMHLDGKSICAGIGSLFITIFGMATLQAWALIFGILASVSTVILNIYKYRKERKK